MAHLIQGRLVFLRPMEAADAPLYQQWRADADVALLAGFSEPLSLAAVERRVGDRSPDDTHAYLICLLNDGRPIGEAALFEHDRINGSAELGIFIGERSEWGKGYGTDAVEAIVAFGFEAQRLERVWLNVWTENPRAQRAYEKAGFVHEGTLRHDRWERGQYTDGHVMSILRDEWLGRRS